MCQNFFSFQGRRVIQCPLHSVYPLPVRDTDSFYCWALLNNIPVHMDIIIFVWASALVSCLSEARCHSVACNPGWPWTHGDPPDCLECRLLIIATTLKVSVSLLRSGCVGPYSSSIFNLFSPEMPAMLFTSSIQIFSIFDNIYKFLYPVLKR